MAVMRAELVGRKAELAAMEFLGEGGTPRGLVLEGEAGIGKTMVWEHGLELLQARGRRVLRSTAGEHEREFAYAVLGGRLPSAR